MPRSPSPQWPIWVFALLCLAWGSTWLAIKIGVAALPPLIFVATRFLAAGGVLLAILWMQGRLRGLRALPFRHAAPGGLLMFSVNYGLMAWGVSQVTSGLAAVVNLTTMPLAITLCSAAYGLSRITWRIGSGLALGSCGLAALFAPAALSRAMDGSVLATPGAAAGFAAILVGAASYAWGTVYTRRHLPAAPALELSTLHALLGGGALLLISALAEPWHGVIAAFTEPVQLGGWAFLVLVTVASTPAYLMLLARWEPTRVSAYAYVCPVIAVAQGWAFGGEVLTPAQGAAALVLGVSAWLVLGGTRPRTQPAPAPQQPAAAPVPVRAT